MSAKRVQMKIAEGEKWVLLPDNSLVIQKRNTEGTPFHFACPLVRLMGDFPDEGRTFILQGPYTLIRKRNIKEVKESPQIERSGHIGIMRVSRKKGLKWATVVIRNKKRVIVRAFDTKAQAGCLYNELAEAYWGPSTRKNSLWDLSAA